jgi:antitoxin component of MazEF toxin-antitoxin module
MIKRLTKTGNSVALVLDRGLLEAANLDPDAPVEISTDGKVIVIAPAPSDEHREKLERGMKAMHAKYAGAFKRLAE